MKKTYKDFGSVFVGYSEDFTPNEWWEEQGLLCEWEHCIEKRPANTGYYKRDSCPIFGHLCPSGAEQVKRCKKIATELWHKIDERFK